MDLVLRIREPGLQMPLLNGSSQRHVLRRLLIKSANLYQELVF